MTGAMPPLPQYAFMAWCSVKAQGLLYLHLFTCHFAVWSGIPLLTGPKCHAMREASWVCPCYKNSTNDVSQSEMEFSIMQAVVERLAVQFEFGISRVRFLACKRAILTAFPLIKYCDSALNLDNLTIHRKNYMW